MIDLTALVNALIAVAALLITSYLIPWIKSQISEQQQEEMLELVRIGCMAAEQLYNTGMIADKKAYVIDYLAQKKINVNLVDVEKMIEATVLEINKEWSKDADGTSRD